MEWVPMMRILQQVYSDHPYECNALVDTALSLIGALFTFVVLPAGDLLLGQDTHGPAEVCMWLLCASCSDSSDGNQGCSTCGRRS